MDDTKIFVFMLLSLIILTGFTFVFSNHSLAKQEEMMYMLGEDYNIVDTSQDKCYDNSGKVIKPEEGDAFFGQDSQYDGNQPHYAKLDDEVVVDITTGLMWQRSPGAKVTFDDAFKNAEKCRMQDFEDWRVPTIKELYSLINFTGSTGQSAKDSVPYIDTDYFEFTYGDEEKGERHIDSQYWSSTEYVSTTMNSDATVFGVNFADGRIKGYPKLKPSRPGSSGKTEQKMYVIFVRGNTDYGKNDFQDNDDGTITDQATKLMWSKNDSEKGMNWEQALAWVQKKNDEEYLGHNDWRLPNIKELQSIVDYSKSPKTTSSAAIDSIFEVTKEKNNTYPFFWSSTTHLDGPKNQKGRAACYVAFGEARGWMKSPRGGSAKLMDVHGAGAQRSDPKEGDPDDYPEGRGPQGDVIKIFNYVRLVRDVGE